MSDADNTELDRIEAALENNPKLKGLIMSAEVTFQQLPQELQKMFSPASQNLKLTPSTGGTVVVTDKEDEELSQYAQNATFRRHDFNGTTFYSAQSNKANGPNAMVFMIREGSQGKQDIDNMITMMQALGLSNSVVDAKNLKNLSPELQQYAMNKLAPLQDQGVQIKNAPQSNMAAQQPAQPGNAHANLSPFKGMTDLRPKPADR